MDYKIVADSTADLLTLPDVAFAAAPLHITVDGVDFVDDASVDLAALDEALARCKGASSTACPSIGAWLEAFGEAEVIFCLTITSALSGSCASARMAKAQYEEEHPGRRVYVIDSLTAGPEITLLAQKLRELILSGRSHPAIARELALYQQRTRLFFSLESLSNLAKNGRISPLVAKLAGFLGIRAIGTASEKGELQLLDKCRGEAKALAALLAQMEGAGFSGGRVSIGHNNNRKAAEALRALVLDRHPGAQIEIHPLRALCSYYAERGGVLVGVEC